MLEAVKPQAQRQLDELEQLMEVTSGALHDPDRLELEDKLGIESSVCQFSLERDLVRKIMFLYESSVKGWKLDLKTKTKYQDEIEGIKPLLLAAMQREKDLEDLREGAVYVEVTRG